MQNYNSSMWFGWTPEKHCLHFSVILSFSLLLRIVNASAHSLYFNCVSGKEAIKQCLLSVFALQVSKSLIFNEWTKDSGRMTPNINRLFAVVTIFDCSTTAGQISLNNDVEFTLPRRWIPMGFVITLPLLYHHHQVKMSICFKIFLLDCHEK